MKRKSKNIIKKKYFIFQVLLCLTFLANNLYSQKDSIHIYFRGDFNKSEKFMFRYGDKGTCIFGYGESPKRIDIAIDTAGLKEYGWLDFSLRKWNRFKQDWEPIRIPFMYYPNLNQIMIYYLPLESTDCHFQIYYLPYFKELF